MTRVIIVDELKGGSEVVCWSAALLFARIAHLLYSAENLDFTQAHYAVLALQLCFGLSGVSQLPSTPPVSDFDAAEIRNWNQSRPQRLESSPIINHVYFWLLEPFRD